MKRSFKNILDRSFYIIHLLFMARPKEFCPEQALQSAMGVFLHHGFAATSMQDLVAAMGVGRGSLYQTFGSKQQLFIAALRRYGDLTVSFMEAGLPANKPALASLKDFMRERAKHALDEDARMGCLLGNTAIERSLHDEESARCVNLQLSRVEAILERTLRRAQEEGDFAKDRNTEATARFFIGQMQALRLMAKVMPDAEAIHDLVEEGLRVLD